MSARLVVLDVYVHSLDYQAVGSTLHYPAGLLLELPHVPPTLISVPPLASQTLTASTQLGLQQPATLLRDMGVSLCTPVEMPVMEGAAIALFTLLGASGGEGETAAHLGSAALPLAAPLAACLAEGGGAQVWQAALTLQSLCGSSARVALTLKATPVPPDLETFFSQHLAVGPGQGVAVGGGSSSGSTQLLPAESAADNISLQLRASPPPPPTPSDALPPPTPAAERALRWGAAELGSGSARAAPALSFGPKTPLLSGYTVTPGASAWEPPSVAAGASCAAAQPPLPPPQGSRHPPSEPAGHAALDDLLADLLRWRDLATSGARATPSGGSPGSTHRLPLPPPCPATLGSSASSLALQAALLESGMDQAAAAGIAHTLSRLHIAAEPEAWRSGQSLEFSGPGQAGAGGVHFLPFGTSPAMERLAAWLPKSLGLLKAAAQGAAASGRAAGEHAGHGAGVEEEGGRGDASMFTAQAEMQVSGMERTERVGGTVQVGQSASPRTRGTRYGGSSSSSSSGGGSSPRSPAGFGRGSAYSPRHSPRRGASQLNSSASSALGSSSRASAPEKDPVRGVRLPLSLRARIAALAEERRFSRSSGGQNGVGGGVEGSVCSGEEGGVENLNALLANLTSSTSGSVIAPPRTPPRAPPVPHQARQHGGGGVGGSGIAAAAAAAAAALPSTTSSLGGFSTRSLGSSSGGSSVAHPQEIAQVYLDMLEVGGGGVERVVRYNAARSPALGVPASAAGGSSGRVPGGVGVAVAAAASGRVPEGVGVAAAAAAAAPLAAASARPSLSHSDVELPNRSTLFQQREQSSQPSPGTGPSSSSCSSSPRGSLASPAKPASGLEGTQFSSASEVYSSDAPASSISGASGAGASASLLQVTRLSSQSSGGGGGEQGGHNPALFVSALSPSPKRLGGGGGGQSARKGQREELVLEGETSLASLSASYAVASPEALPRAPSLQQLHPAPSEAARAFLAGAASALAANGGAGGGGAGARAPGSSAPAPVSEALARARAKAQAARERAALEIDDVPDSPEMALAPRDAFVPPPRAGGGGAAFGALGALASGAPSSRQAYFEQEEEDEMGEVSEEGVLSPPKMAHSKAVHAQHLQAPFRGASSTPTLEEEDVEEEGEEGEGEEGGAHAGYGLAARLPSTLGGEEEEYESDSPDDDF